jgi:cytoskeleton protein RodZ
MNIENQDQSETRTEPTMFADGPRRKPDGKSDPAGEVGWFLQREREKRGLSLEAAGEATGIHPYHVEAIEYGDMTHMPQRLEALEMIAGYAQYLGFDAEPLVEHMMAFLPPPPVARKTFHPASPPLLSSAKVLAFGKMPKLPQLNIRLGNYPGGTGGIVASAFAMFIVIAGANWMMTSTSATTPDAVQSAQVAPIVDDMPTASTGTDTGEVKIVDSPMQTAAVAPAADDPAAGPAIAAAEETDSMGSFIQEQIPAPKSGKSTQIATGDIQQTDDGRVYGAGNDQARVVLKAKGPVWLRIEDAKGNVVMTQMLSTGDTYRVPNRDGLIALSRDGGRLAYMIDGKEKGVLGPAGQILVGEKLDVAALESKK